MTNQLNRPSVHLLLYLYKITNWKTLRTSLHYIPCEFIYRCKQPVLPAASTPALHPERTTRAVAKPMRMNEEYYRPGMNSLSSPNSAPVLRLRPENNRPGRDYSQPLNLTENVTAQDRALSEQV